jgi:hypothetical protein
MAAWKLPLIVSALTVPIVAAFLVGGAPVGVAVGALTVFVLLVVAARQRPEDPIVPPSVGDHRPHFLLVVTRPLEDPGVIGEIAHEAGGDHGEEVADVLVLAPARIGFLDRWASDVEGARQAAQQNLVVTVAALAKAGIAAEARVGDESVVQAVEDQLQSFPATKVLLVGDADNGDGVADAITELQARLRVDFRHLNVPGG